MTVTSDSSAMWIWADSSLNTPLMAVLFQRMQLEMVMWPPQLLAIPPPSRPAWLSPNVQFVMNGVPDSFAQCSSPAPAKLAVFPKNMQLEIFAVPNEAIARRLEDVVESDGEFDGAEAPREVPASLCPEVDQLLAKLVCHGYKLILRQPPQIPRFANLAQDAFGRRPGRPGLFGHAGTDCTIPHLHRFARFTFTTLQAMVIADRLG